MEPSLQVRSLWTLPGILAAVFVIASVRGSPVPIECTKFGAVTCFSTYSLEWANPALRPDKQGRFREEAFMEACRIISEKNICHKTFLKCPAAFKANFTKQEEGYEAMREFVCDTQAHKDLQTSLACMDHHKLECEISDLDLENTNFFDVQGVTCKAIRTSVKCFDTKFNSSCPLSLKKAKASFLDLHRRWAMLLGCAQPIGAAASAHLSRFLLGAMAVSLLRRL